MQLSRCCLTFLASMAVTAGAKAQHIGFSPNSQVVDPFPGPSVGIPIGQNPLQIVIPKSNTPAGVDASCKNAAIDMLSLLNDDPRRLDDYSKASFYARDSVWGPKIKSYKSTCFSSLSNLPQALQNSGFGSWAGLLQFGGNKPQCSAFLIAPNILETARHCLFNDDGTPWSWARDVTKIKFYPFGTPNVPVSVKSILFPSEIGDISNITPVSPASDSIKLILAHPISTRLPPIRAPKVGESLAIGGPFTLDGSGNPVVTFGRGCVITKVDGNCIVHRCQTMGGFSGSALIALDADGSVAIVGMHLGPDSYTHCTDDAGNANGAWTLNSGDKK